MDWAAVLLGLGQRVRGATLGLALALLCLCRDIASLDAHGRGTDGTGALKGSTLKGRQYHAPRSRQYQRWWSLAQVVLSQWGFVTLLELCNQKAS